MLTALHSVIRDGRIDDYRERHARIPDDLRELFDRVGIRDWIIWRSGDRLFHVVDCDDLDGALAAIDRDPANVAWQADIGPLVAGFHGPDGEDAFTPIEQVWSLEGQRAADAG